MDIIITNPEQGIANFEPLKAWAIEQANLYGSQIVDPDAITTAKADCASLRKLAKAASDLRIKIKKENEAKIATVTAQLVEVTGIFNAAATRIDDQIKEYDEQRKAQRRTEIEAIYASEIEDMGDILPLNALWRDSWLNKTTTDKSIKGDIQTAKINAKTALAAILSMNSPHANALIAEYTKRQSMADVLEAKRRFEEADAAMKRRQIEQEEREAEEAVSMTAPRPTVQTIKPEPEKFDLDFSVFKVTQTQVDELVDFLESNGYTYLLGL